MALRRLLKTQIKLSTQVQQIRGAHGWPRPDVPVDFSYNYKPKREYSVYDLNCWYYDHTQPEYMFTWNEQHLEDEFKAIRELGGNLPTIWILMAGLGVFYTLFSNSREFSGVLYHFVKDQHYQFTLDLYTQRKAMKRNWLDLDLYGDNGCFYANYDVRDRIKVDFENAISAAQETIKINEEGKGFIEKMIQEAEHQVASKKK